MDKLRIYNCKWTSYSAGPSPHRNGARTEIFLAGCKKAESGQPCKGCFNPGLWQSSNYVGECTAKEAFGNILAGSRYKAITFVGGEPLDQAEPLANLCTMLHQSGFHIIVFTHYLMEDLVSVAGEEAAKKLLNSIDILIDGEYVEAEHIRHGDSAVKAIGSGNQVVWDLKQARHDGELQRTHGVAAENILGMSIRSDGNLSMILKDSGDSSGLLQAS